MVGCSSPPLSGPNLAHGTKAVVRSKPRPEGHSFGIYLVTGPSERSSDSGREDLSILRLADSPIISDAAIIAYHWSAHSITVTTNALRNLPEPSVFGTPFVVVADGQRIYQGVFTTPYSSITMYGGATIRVWPFSRTDNPLQIGFDPWQAVGGPPVHFVALAEPRNDPRIERALAALQKLK